LNDKVAHDAAIVGMHAGTKCVEDACDAHFNIVLIFVRVHHGFRDTFALVVARAGTNRVDVAPVGFRLGMDLGITVDFTGTRQQDASFDAFGETQHVQGAHGTGFDGFDGIVLVMRGRGGACEMIDLVDFQRELLRDIVNDQTVVMR
jgi:hypothetical protein